MKWLAQGGSGGKAPVNYFTFLAGLAPSSVGAFAAGAAGAASSGGAFLFSSVMTSVLKSTASLLCRRKGTPLGDMPLLSKTRS